MGTAGFYVRRKAPVTLIARSNLVARFRMSGVIPLFPHMPSWCTEGELLSSISLIDGLSDHDESAPSFEEHRMDFTYQNCRK